MEIAQCGTEDVEAFGAPHAVAQRRRQSRHPLARQRAGESTYPIPGREGSPVGHPEIRWTGRGAPQVQAALPGCPEINGLFVRPAALRCQGVGTALVHTVGRLPPTV
ncbi:hypothetical protein ACIBQ5_26160 [Streptomyces massasporeus]|uniref:hypothetical protein n=1 Tax=Streptomyces massasporeus TaxID=67324 RepID=UPI0037B307B1